MTLLDYFPDAFEDKEKSALAHLISQVQAHNFDQEEINKSTNLSNKVAIGSEVPTDQFLKAFVENALDNMVQISNDDIAYELFIASIIKKKPRLFLNNPLYILNSQEGTETAMRLWQEDFSGTEHKQKVLQSIHNFIGRHKKMNRLADNISIIIDELFSNAIFNAPIDAQGNRLYRNMDRDAKVSFPQGKHAKIFAVHTNDNLFVGAVDPWGSIDRDRICKSFYHAYSERTVTEGKGAGFGLRMMLDRSRSLYILSEKAKRSLVCCHMRLNISLKKIESVPKQLHINCF
jgi:hypothetical protein